MVRKKAAPTRGSPRTDLVVAGDEAFDDAYAVVNRPGPEDGIDGERLLKGGDPAVSVRSLAALAQTRLPPEEESDQEISARKSGRKRPRPVLWQGPAERPEAFAFCLGEAAIPASQARELAASGGKGVRLRLEAGWASVGEAVMKQEAARSQEDADEGDEVFASTSLAGILGDVDVSAAVVHLAAAGKLWVGLRGDPGAVRAPGFRLRPVREGVREGLPQRKRQRTFVVESDDDSDGPSHESASGSKPCRRGGAVKAEMTTNSPDMVDSAGSAKAAAGWTLELCLRPEAFRRDASRSTSAAQLRILLLRFHATSFRQEDLQRWGFGPVAPASAPPGVGMLYRMLESAAGSSIEGKPKFGEASRRVAGLLPELRPYQVDALRWMIARERGADAALAALPRAATAAPRTVPTGRPPSPDTTFGSTLSDLHRAFGWARLQSFGDDAAYICNLYCGILQRDAPLATLGHQGWPIFRAPAPGGILADEMGLGKTVEVLALLANDPPRPPRPVPEAAPAKVTFADPAPGASLCICQNVDCPASDAPPGRIACAVCKEAVHVACAGPDPTTECVFCAGERLALHPLVTEATLLLCPRAILHQWEAECRRHLDPQHLSSFTYPGVADAQAQIAAGKRHPSLFVTVDPRHLAGQTLILCALETLVSEGVHLGATPRSRRPRKRYRNLVSSLACLRFRRVIVDEAQLVKATPSAKSEILARIVADIRWCVTGTPVGPRGADDLYELLHFLGASPLRDRGLWRNVVGRPGSLGVLGDVFGPRTWRNTKAGVLHQLGLPSQREEVHVLELSPIEKYIYDKQAREVAQLTTKTFSGKGRGTSTAKSGEGLLMAFYRLRQACCHPQVGGKGVKGTGPMTLEEIVRERIERARGRAEEGSRLAIMCMSALAGLARCLADSVERTTSDRIEEAIADVARAHIPGNNDFVAVLGDAPAAHDLGTPDPRRSTAATVSSSPVQSASVSPAKSPPSTPQRKETSVPITPDAPRRSHAPRVDLQSFQPRNLFPADRGERARALLLAQSARWYEKILEREKQQITPSRVLAALRLTGCEHFQEEASNVVLTPSGNVFLSWAVPLSRGMAGSTSVADLVEQSRGLPPGSGRFACLPKALQRPLEASFEVVTAGESAMKKLVQIIVKVTMPTEPFPAVSPRLLTLQARRVKGGYDDVAEIEIPRLFAQPGEILTDTFRVAFDEAHAFKAAGWRVLVKKVYFYVREGHAAPSPLPGTVSLEMSIKLFQAQVDVDALQVLHAARNLLAVRPLLERPDDILRRPLDHLHSRCAAIEERFLSERQQDKAHEAQTYGLLRRKAADAEEALADVSARLTEAFLGAPSAKPRPWFEIVVAMVLEADAPDAETTFLDFLRNGMDDAREKMGGGGGGGGLHDARGVSLWLAQELGRVEQAVKAARHAVDAALEPVSSMERALNTECGVCRNDWGKVGPACPNCHRHLPLDALEQTLDHFRMGRRGDAALLAQQRLAKGETESFKDAGAGAELAGEKFRSPSRVVLLCELLEHWVHTVARRTAEASGGLREKRVIALASEAAKLQLSLTGKRRNDVDKGFYWKERSLARRVVLANGHLLSAHDELVSTVTPLRLLEPGEALPLVRSAQEALLQSREEALAKREKFAMELAMFDAQRTAAQEEMRFLQYTAGQRLEADRQEDCAVCLEGLTGLAMALWPCGHAFHESCSNSYLRGRSGVRAKCPTCRRAVPIDDVRIAVDMPAAPAGNPWDAANRSLFGSKIARLVALLRDEIPPGDKVLIFSQWDDLLRIAEAALTAAKVPHVYAKSRARMRDAVEPFRDKPELRCLLLPLRVGGQGLTLTAAQHVVMLEPLVNAALDAQAVNRVHRIGQERETTVHRLVVRNTVEERLEEQRAETRATMSSYELHEGSQKKGAFSKTGEGLRLEVLQDLLESVAAQGSKAATDVGM